MLPPDKKVDMACSSLRAAANFCTRCMPLTTRLVWRTLFMITMNSTAARPTKRQAERIAFLTGAGKKEKGGEEGKKGETMEKVKNKKQRNKQVVRILAMQVLEKG